MPRTTKESSEEIKDRKAKTTAKKANTTKTSTTNTTKKSSSKSTVESKKAKSNKATTTKKKTSIAKKDNSKAKTIAKKTTTKSESSTVSIKKSNTSKVAKKTTSKNKTVTKKKEPVYILEYYDLPYRYNKTVVKVLAQTPTTLFVYWDISDEDRANYISQYGDNFFETTKPVLVIHNETKNYTYEVEINDFANSWYLHISDPDCKYYMELGRRPKDNYSEFIPITDSNQTYAPNDHVLFNSINLDGLVKYRNVKSQNTFNKAVASYVPQMSKIYNIHDLYKLLYKNDFDLIKDSRINSPSSGGISSFK